MLTSALIFICIVLTVASTDKKKAASKNKPKRGIIIARVSTTEQKKGTSLETQEQWARKQARLMGVKIILKPIKKDMSGEIFPKEHYKKIIDFVKKKEITHLYVYSFDRLSRSFAYGVRLVKSLWENDVQIVTSTFSPDHTKHTHRIRVWMTLLFAEMERGGISERTRRGITHKLEQGIYPRKSPPWGCERVDLKLRLKSGYKQIIKDIFNMYIKVTSYAETSRIINGKYNGQLDVPLTASKVRQIINNRIYTGFYCYNGLLFGEGGENGEPRQEMQAIDEKTFERAQKIAQGNKSKYSNRTNLLLPSIEKWMDEYGPGYVKNHFNLSVNCPRCISVNLQKDGNQIRNASLMKLYICKDCGHHFRFPSAKQIKEFRSLHPLRCMNCGTADNFAVEGSQLVDYYRVICEECDFEALVRKDKTMFPEEVIKRGK